MLRRFQTLRWSQKLEMSGTFLIMGFITLRNRTRSEWCLIAAHNFKVLSLNSCLMQGPGLTNKLAGMIFRFRKEPVAIICDVEKMFYQFRVSACHQDHTGKCIRQFGGIYVYCRYFIDWKW